MKLKNYFLLFLFFLLQSFVFSQTKATGKEVMIQGFHWTTDVSATKWYEVIKSNSSALQIAGFDAIWLPPPSKSTGGMGYIPTVWYDLNNAQGTQAQLVSLITDLHSKNIKVIADIVINHRGGTLGWYDFSTPSWNTPAETWSICNNSNISASGQKGTGNPDYDPVAAGLKSAGESGSFSAARDLDHSNASVRDGIKTWMNWLKNDIGFDGWRYDFVHGYDGKYIKEYNDATNPYFSVGELLEGDRSRIVKWMDYTKAGTATASSTAFDFSTKSALQNAFRDNNLSYLKDGSGKASGLIGVWPSNAVTMLDNHDTGPKPYGQDLWIFPGDQVLKGYAYLLTHPGTPMVWWPHYFNWGIKNEIDAMIKIRKDNGLSSTSNLNIVAATNNLYAAIIDDKVALKLGSDNWSPSGTGWTLKLSGSGFAIWDKGTVTDVPSLTNSQAGGTFSTGTTLNVVLTANNSSSTIYYTLDGTTPSTASASAIGTKTLSITANTTLKAFVKNAANVSSAVYTENYTFAALPTFTVYFKKPVAWASTMKIYYWGVTGTAPALTWPGVAMTQDCGDWYTYTFPSTVSASNLLFTDGTLKTADLTATAGIKYYDSAWLSAEPANKCPAVTPDLTILQAGGTFTAGTTVNAVLTANVNTSTIYYTLDGTTPTTASASAIGTKTLAITANTTVKAFIKNTAGTFSAIKTEVYNFVTPTTFTVYFKKPSAWASAVKIYYWGTTGTAPAVTWPGVAMTQDCGDWYAFTFPSTVTASNIIFTDGTLKTADLTATAGIKYYDSAWLSTEPTNRCPVVTPDLTISQPGGTFSSGTTVNMVLTANVNTSTIYYTLDGTTPTTASASAVGTKTLSITANTTVKALAKNTAGTLSIIKTAVYTFITVPTLTVYYKPPATWTGTPKVHYWNAVPAGSVANSAWPGVAMTADANGFYKYTITGPTSINLIFNNGSSGAANQTVDLLNKADGYSYTWGASTSKLGTKKEEATTKTTSVALYPNPVNNLLQINSDVVALDYQILSNNGTAVQKGKVNDNSIDVISLPSGLYFVKIHFIDGQEYLQKIIKK
nr:starch-binding protein [uncultured Flavobacterium sp.]